MNLHWKSPQLLEDPSRPSRRELDQVMHDFVDLPPEAIIKEDILRSGLFFSDDALKVASGYKPKAYFIFSFDLTPLNEMERREDLHSPEEIKIHSGPLELAPTIISVRNSHKSAYSIDLHQGQLALFLEEVLLAFVELPATPSYYHQKLASGQPMHEVTPTIEWGYLIYLTAYRLCQYWGKEEECLFCDINQNYRQQKKLGRPYKVTKDIEDILAGLAILDQKEPNSKAYTITGGSITTRLQGKDEAEFYLPYAQAIEDRFPGRWLGKIGIQALPIKQLKPFHEAGIRIYHPNYEIWDKDLFPILCPGKERYVGREVWHQRILDSAELFGLENVIPNFVAGIEMSRPYGYTKIEPAVASAREGLEFFMSRGISPRYTVWCPEPSTQLGHHNYGAPLRYHAGLMQAWKETHANNHLKPPPGYGEPGKGKAVFSVSAFMDII